MPVGVERHRAPRGSRRARRPSRSSGTRSPDTAPCLATGRADASRCGSDATSSLVPTHATDVRGVDVDAEAAADPRRGGLAQRDAARRRRVAHRAARRRRARLHRDVGHRVARGADRAVDDAAGQRVGEPLERVEPVVRVRRRHEAARDASTMRPRLPGVGARRTRRSDRSTGLRAAGPAPGCRRSSCTSTSTSPSRCSAASTSPRSYGTRSSTICVERAQPVADAWRAGRRRPSPVAADTRDRAGMRDAAGRAIARGRPRSDLFHTSSSGIAIGVDLARAPRRPRRSGRSTSRDRSRRRRAASRSASTTSSSVERNASTSWCGSRRTNPTVSESSTVSPPGSRSRRVRRVERGEQLVLDEHAGVGEPVEQRRLPRVRVADERDGRERAPAAAPCVGSRGCGRDCTRSRSSFVIRRRIRRRSTSSCVSPGPRVPMPPPCWLSCVPAAAQARQPVAELRELDLHHALLARRVLGEDVEDQRDAIDDVDLEQLLEVALLRGRELVVEDRRRRCRAPPPSSRSSSALPLPT